MKFQENKLVDEFARKLKNELCTKLEIGRDYGIVLDKIDEILARDVSVEDRE